MPRAKNTRRKLCCGRTFLSSGLIDEAKLEATRLLENLSHYVEREVPIVGLEPSCVFTIKDELPSLLPGTQAQKLADHVQLLEEYLITENDAGRLSLKFRTSEPEKVLLHGHCHQKAFDAMDCTIKLLESVPGIEVETIHSGCCGMAGSFGYQAEHYEISMEMAELSLLPHIRQATDQRTHSRLRDELPPPDRTRHRTLRATSDQCAATPVLDVMIDLAVSDMMMNCITHGIGSGQDTVARRFKFIGRPPADCRPAIRPAAGSIPHPRAKTGGIWLW